MATKKSTQTFASATFTVTWTVAGFGGAPPGTCPPPYGPKFSQFHAVFLKIWQNHMLAPPGGLVSPPRGNPGSAPDGLSMMKSF